MQQQLEPPQSYALPAAPIAPYGPGHVHRLLPIPPTQNSLGALQTRESQLYSQQQQYALDSSRNLGSCFCSQQSLSGQPRSPIVHRRRSSSIAGNLLHAPLSTDENLRIAHAHADDESHRASNLNLCIAESGVLTFQQAMSGAVSPQYAGTGLPMSHERDISCLLGSSSALAAVVEDTNTSTNANTSTTSGPDANDSTTSQDSATPFALHHQHHHQLLTSSYSQVQRSQQQSSASQQRERGVGEAAYPTSAEIEIAAPVHGSASTIAATLFGTRLNASAERQRLRTSSMPAENRKPRLADTRRSAIQCGLDGDVNYYRLRSFSITNQGVCNLGDSLRSRMSRSINSVASTGTSHSGVDRHNSNASRISADVNEANAQQDSNQTKQSFATEVPAYKIAMLGPSGVGKTTLTYQFTTSDYICAYDLSLDDDYGQKTVSVLVDDIETDLEVIDHPACEMSTEAFCATYNIDLFVVVYSVVDRCTYRCAERVLQYLKENDMLLTRGAILVGNKTDLERHRQVSRHVGCRLAKTISCKFIETSSGLDHNVDELLVGIVAQVKLNPQRIRLLSQSELQRLNLQSTIQNHRRMHLPARRMVRQLSVCQPDEEEQNDNVDVRPPEIGAVAGGSNRSQQVRKPNRRKLNLESILKMGESELEEEESTSASASDANRTQSQSQSQSQSHTHGHAMSAALSKFEQLTASMRQRRYFKSKSSKSSSSVKQRSADYDTGPSTSAQAAAARAKQQRRNQTLDDSVLERIRRRYGRGSQSEMEDNEQDDSDDDDNSDSDAEQAEAQLDCNRKVVNKLTKRTKTFITSMLRFKRNIKRRSSSSCTDLFII
ncbi:uncharacterized protein LOC108604938 [Drosophila busckii]|uniref:uncharacterized protein LOC108604938 n=1 Tax=Drosophila busckii TaxID=30019 RepID=UPI00083F022E|nr:uncharacterized protein LOC108604938 [Drosophila busckii]